MKTNSVCAECGRGWAVAAALVGLLGAPLLVASATACRPAPAANRPASTSAPGAAAVDASSPDVVLARRVAAVVRTSGAVVRASRSGDDAIVYVAVPDVNRITERDVFGILHACGGAGFGSASIQITFDAVADDGSVRFRTYRVRSPGVLQRSQGHAASLHPKMRTGFYCGWTPGLTDEAIAAIAASETPVPQFLPEQRSFVGA